MNKLVPKKFVCGVRVANKMFRVTSKHGELLDQLLAGRGTGALSENYFDQIGTTERGDQITLTNSEKETSLKVSVDDVVFTKSTYKQEGSINFERTFKEFKQLFETIESVLTLRDVYRIGMVAEYRMATDGSPSEYLFKNLSVLPAPVNTAGFNMRYESRRWIGTAKAEAPDPTKDPCYNLIFDYYDSSRDDSFPAPDSININIDVQRYFHPVIASGVQSATKTHFEFFRQTCKTYKAGLIKKGLEVNE